jgi:hypothetical protein
VGNSLIGYIDNVEFRDGLTSCSSGFLGLVSLNYAVLAPLHLG